MSQIEVLFFGPVADLTGCRQLSLPYVAGQTVAELKHSLQQQYPAAFELVCFIALDGQQLSELQQPLRPGAELVFMSKFSGG